MGRTLLAVSPRSRGSILLLLMTCLSCATASAQTARVVAQHSFPSVVLLMMQDGDGQPLSLGSGFYVRPGIVATNLHVVAGASGGTAKVVGRAQATGILGLVGVDVKSDLALLRVGIEDAPSLALADSATISPGDEVFAIGNPLGLEGTISQGIVSGLREFGGTTILQVTAPISPGSSGGPIMNARGEVIGVAVATHKDGQNLNFAVASKHLTALLDASANTVMQTLAALRTAKTSHPQLGSNANTGIEITNEQLLHTGSKYRFIEFSAKNQLAKTVTSFDFVVIYREPDGSINDSIVHTVDGPILPGLAKRVKMARSGRYLGVDAELVSRHGLNSALPPFGTHLAPVTARDVLRKIYEIRILSIKISP